MEESSVFYVCPDLGSPHSPELLTGFSTKSYVSSQTLPKSIALLIALKGFSFTFQIKFILLSWTFKKHSCCSPSFYNPISHYSASSHIEGFTPSTCLFFAFAYVFLCLKSNPSFRLSPS